MRGFEGMNLDTNVDFEWTNLDGFEWTNLDQFEVQKTMESWPNLENENQGKESQKYPHNPELEFE